MIIFQGKFIKPYYSQTIQTEAAETLCSKLYLKIEKFKHICVMHDELYI